MSDVDEFGTVFQEHLLKVLENCYQVHPNDQSTGPVLRRLRKFMHGFNRRVFGFLCDLIGIDLIGNFSWSKQQLSIGAKLDRLLHEHSRRSKAMWPRILQVAYLLVCAYQLVCVYFLYVYQTNNMKLDKIRTVSSGGNLIGHQFDKLAADFRLRASHARAVLKLTGINHLEWPLIIQNMTIVFILINVHLYFLAPAHYIVYGWPLLGTLAIVDAELERRAQVDLIISQLRGYSTSSRLLAVNQLEQMGRSLAGIVGARASSASAADRVLQRAFQELGRRHTTLIKQLKFIALTGRLAPLNRSAGHLDRLSATLFISLTMAEVYIQSLIFGGRRILIEYFESRGTFDRLETVQDYFYELCFLLVLQVVAHAVALLGSILCITLYDLMSAAGSLGELMNETVRRNELRFTLLMFTLRHSKQAGEGPTRGARAAEAQFKRAIERDLLVVSIECRTVCKNMEMAKTPLSLLAFLAVWFSALMLVMSRLHNPYFDPELRSMNSVLSICCVAVSLIYLAPISLLHRQTIKSFKTLWTLVAQLSYFETVPDVARLLDSGSSVAFISLRRELSDTRLRMSELACKVLTLPLTSQNLTKIAFWALLVIISISGNLNLGGEGLARLADDPFGLFDFMALNGTRLT